MDVAVIDPPVFPHICVNCARAADIRIPVEQVHRIDTTDSEGGTSHTHVFSSFQPYFCRDCAAIHRQELPPFDLKLVFSRLLAAWTVLIPAFGSACVAAVLLPVVFRSLLRGPASSVFFSAGLFALFALLSLVCLLVGWRNTRHLAPHPSTSITQAIVFSPDRSETFEPAWRVFTLLNDAYAQQFREANGTRFWDKHSPRAQRAFAMRYWSKMALFVLVGVGVLWYFYDEWIWPVWQWLRPYFDR